MRNCNTRELVISGLGVISAIGLGKAGFSAALLEGEHAFGVMRRPGRQQQTSFLGAEIRSLPDPGVCPSRDLRTASFSAQAGLIALREAWCDARLEGVDPPRIGLIVGGSNFQQRELVRMHDAYRARVQFLRPTYGLSFMDSDLCGLCTEQFPIRGFAHTVGAGSASGHVAVLEALEAVQSERVDACIALGALMDLSYWECLGFRALGAMGSDRYATKPAEACRPFDQSRDGFIFGECCGAVVVERHSNALGRRAKPYAQIAGWSTVMDGHRNPDPSLEGEIQVIKNALHHANLTPREIDYVNPHGSGSVAGDRTEAQAIAACGLAHARINATKSIVGHGLSAAGVVEIIATLVQMERRTLHPTRNLEDPVNPNLHWIAAQAIPHTIENAINLSIGFGGINTAICLRRSPSTGSREDINGSSRH